MRIYVTNLFNPVRVVIKGVGI